MTSLAELHPHALDKFISFDPIEHKYTFKNNVMKQSVTELVHRHFPKFDADMVAEKLFKNNFDNKKSNYYQKTKEQIIQQWEDNKNEACTLGTNLHQSIEDTYNGKEVHNDSKEFMYFQNFQKDYSHLRPFRTEWEVCYEDKSLAGSIDMVFQNPDGTYSIYDWKRCKKMDKYNDFEFGLEELDHIPHSNFWHYSFQLNIYKYILENVYNFPIHSLFLVVMHPNNPNYQIYECPNLQNEVKGILDKL